MEKKKNQKISADKLVKMERAYKLIYDQLPDEMAEELLAGKRPAAKHYGQVSIIFTDIKNFTSIAESYRPQQLVEILNKYFTQFDEISNKYKVERIKTIGDSYMGVAGCPIRKREHAVNAVLAALEIQNWICELEDLYKAKNEDYIQLKIGINTGEAVAGIIGKFRHAFDVWGEAVNIAWRVQEACEAGKINISETTYNYIAPFFDVEERGKIETKHKAKVKMYYVTGIKKGLHYRQKPNQLFWENVKLTFYSQMRYGEMEAFVVDYLKKNLPDGLHYHGIHHTIYVAKAAEKIALHEGVEGDDLFLVKTAALFHDAGFIWEYRENEKLGAKLARKFLPNFGYTKNQVRRVCDLILATKVPQAPKGLLQRVICDADLFYLGNPKFHKIADSLFMELEERKEVSDKRQWDEIQVKFLTAHQFHTAFAKKKAQPGKERHLNEIKARLLGQ